MKTLRFVLAAVALTTFSGCFDLLEEIWINADGTARVVMDVALPKSVMQLAGRDPITELRNEAKRSEDELRKDPNITKYSFRDYEEAGMHHLVWDLEVKDATKLGDLQKRAMAKAQGGDEAAQDLDFRIERAGNGNLVFVQRFGKGGLEADAGVATASLEEQAMKDIGKQMAMAMFAGRYVTVRVHGPAILETNGTLSEKRDAVEWKIPVADLMAQTPRELRAEIQTGAPLWVWGLIIGVPAILLLLVVSAMKRRARATAS